MTVLRCTRPRARPLVQLDALLPALPDRLDERATGAELIHERLRHSRQGRADDDGVVRGTGRHPEGPVAEYDLGIADALPGQPQAGLVDRVGPALDGADVRGQAGRQRGLPAVSGPDLQNLFVSGEAESGAQHGDRRGLGGHLPVGEGNGVAPVRGCHLARGDEFRPGDAPYGRQETVVVTPTVWAARTRSSGFPSWATGPRGRGGGAGGLGRGAFRSDHDSLRRRPVADLGRTVQRHQDVGLRAGGGGAAGCGRWATSRKSSARRSVPSVQKLTGSTRSPSEIPGVVRSAGLTSTTRRVPCTPRQRSLSVDETVIHRSSERRVCNSRCPGAPAAWRRKR